MEDVKIILLVEDETIIALHTQRTLKKFGYSVLTAFTGEQAVEIVRSSPENEPVDLILMDIDLGPGIDGPEAAEQILSLHSIPIVFLTSHSEREMVEKVRGITRYGYVIKNSGDFVLNSSIEMAFELFEANKKLKTELDEHIRTQAALAKSEEKFYKAFQASPNAIAFTTLDKGEYIDVNDAFLRMTGYTKDQVIGRSSVEIDIWTDLAERKKYIDLLMTHHTLRNFEAKFRMKDGHIGDYLVSTEVIVLDGKTYGINFIVDITEQKAAESELLDTRIKLEQKNHQLTKTMHELNIILENAPVGISKIIDRKQHLVNRKTETLFQYPREEMEFQSTRKLYVSDEAYEKFGREAYPMLANGEVFESVQDLVRKDGQHIFVKYIGRALEPPDMSKGTIWILEDITDKKLAEEKIEMLLREKEFMLKEVHHRIKNHMSTIISLLAAQQAEMNMEKGESSAIDSAVSRIRSMMLLYDKLYRSDNFMETSTAGYLPDLIDEIVKNMAVGISVITEKNIEDISLDIKRLQPLAIIINELVSNAVKHAFNGKKTGLISVSLREINGMVKLVIKDNGTGMPGGIDFNNSRGFGHTLVTALADQINAALKAENENGTVVTIEFPK